MAIQRVEATIPGTRASLTSLQKQIDLLRKGFCTSKTKTVANVGSGWFRIAIAPAGNNVGVFRVAHEGTSKKGTLVFSVTQAQGSSKPIINILGTDISDR